MDKKTTIRQILLNASKKLSKTSSSPSLDAEVILSYLLKKPREYILANPGNILRKSQTARFDSLVRKRANGVPVAYITGAKEFYGHNFTVNKDVLVPRPETEELVDIALAHVKLSAGPLRIIDLGTGSGCIAVTLAKNLGSKRVAICASDISPAALRVARKNAKIHKAKVRFFQSDLLKDVPGKFDLVIANLPYVSDNIYRAQRKFLKYEPKLAITARNHGTGTYLRLLSKIKQHLRPSGVLVAEIDPSQRQILKSAASKLSGIKLIFQKDLSGRCRYIIATYKT